MNKTIIGLLVLVVLGGGIAFWAASKPEMKGVDVMMDKEVTPEVMPKDVMPGDTMVKDEVAMTKGTYEDYAPEKIALAEEGKVVLFFYAPWCPTCRGIDADIIASMGAIPEGVHILKVDYDSSKDLKIKYGVTYQHTFVQVDKDGNQITKWSGGSTLSSVLEKIK